MAKEPKKIEQKPLKTMAKEPKKVEEDILKDDIEDEEDEDTGRLSSPEDIEEEKEEKVYDYLLPYQYKKVNNIPTIGGVLTNPDKGSKAEIMKEALLSQKRISILIPLDPGSNPKVPYSVTLNGYRLDLPVNTYIEVPMQIAEVIRQANNQTLAALSRDRVDGDSKKEEALH